MPFKAGQEAEAFKALMSAARQLELGLEFVTSNSSAVSEFDYGEVDFEEGLDQTVFCSGRERPARAVYKGRARLDQSRLWQLDSHLQDGLSNRLSH